MKQKFPREEAARVASELLEVLAPACRPGFCVAAGSLRRQKREVGDIEIVYVSESEEAMGPGEFLARPELKVDRLLTRLAQAGRIGMRPNAKGLYTWGPQIKLARHVASGIPVDLFAACAESWWNYLVCRTGSAESNLAIAKAARARGWKWEPYSSGFVRADAPGGGPSERHAVRSEREVFEFVGLPYAEPEMR